MVKVLDACSAPGNKTVHLAALMKGNGRIVACELVEKRVERLKYTINLSGASSILLWHVLANWELYVVQPVNICISPSINCYTVFHCEPFPSALKF